MTSTPEQSNLINNGHISYYLAQPDGSLTPTPSNQKLLSIELPRVTADEVDSVIIVSGLPAQKYNLVFKKDSSLFHILLETDSAGLLVKKLSPTQFSEGDSELVGVYKLNQNYEPVKKINLQSTTRNGSIVITHYAGDTSPYVHKVGSVIFDMINGGSDKSNSYINVDNANNYGFVGLSEADLTTEDLSYFKTKDLTPVHLTITCPNNLMAGSSGTCSATAAPAASLTSGYWTVNGQRVANSNAYPYTWHNIPAGTYQVQGFAIDVNGNNVQSNLVIVVVR
ncbi:MAG: hypothetical protein ABL930_11330 [Pseudobdellovibrio sp.]